jgi:hypothetical protein
MKNQLTTDLTLIDWSWYILSNFSVLSFKILMKLYLSLPSVIIPSDMTAAYLCCQAVAVILSYTNFKTGACISLLMSLQILSRQTPELYWTPVSSSSSSSSSQVTFRIFWSMSWIRSRLEFLTYDLVGWFAASLLISTSVKVVQNSIP